MKLKNKQREGKLPAPLGHVRLSVVRSEKRPSLSNASVTQAPCGVITHFSLCIVHCSRA